MTPSPLYSRRAFLALAGVGLLVGCTPIAGPVPDSSAESSPMPTAPGATTVQALIASKSFFVAHRGSGDNWPEHSLTAYRSALKAGADAIEISVCATADGVLICHHDLSGARTLGVDRKISDLTWSELKELRIDARTWLGPQTPLEPVSRLEDVLQAVGDDALIFIEDKQGTNTRALLDLLDDQPRSRERFVWKQWAPASQVAMAKERGYLAWGYFDTEQFGQLTDFAENFDILGVPTQIDDDSLALVIASGLPVMCWEVHFHAERERLDRLGVAGKMCSNVPYLVGGVVGDSDDFRSGQRAAGDLPSGFESAGWHAQPGIDAEHAVLRVQSDGSRSYLMGSMGAPRRKSKAFDVSVRWPDKVPESGGVGVVFAAVSDAPGGDGNRGTTDGYELVLSGDGMLRIMERVVGRTGAVLVEQQGTPPQAGAVVSLHVDLDSTRIRAERADDATVLDLDDSRWRGPWMRLFKDYESSIAVEFSQVKSVLS